MLGLCEGSLTLGGSMLGFCEWSLTLEIAPVELGLGSTRGFLAGGEEGGCTEVPGSCPVIISADLGCNKYRVVYQALGKTYLF